MPTIDDFLRPKEWIPEIVLDMGKVIRQWGEDRYLPIRRQVDEDWKEHKLVKPLMKELLVDLGLAKGVWPAEVGGMDIPNLATFFAVICDELSRFDSAFALAVASVAGGRCFQLRSNHIETWSYAGNLAQGFAATKCIPAVWI